MDTAEYTLLLKYDLRFFGNDEGGEKTEEATPKKLDDARKKGQVAKSRELVMAVSLIALFYTLQFFGLLTGERFVDVFKWIYADVIPEYTSMYRSGFTPQAFNTLFIGVALQMLILVAPYFLVGVIIAFLGTVLQIGFKVTPEPMKPKLSKLSPLNGVKRLFSKQQLFELVKSLLKVAIIFYIAYITVKDDADFIYIIYDMPLTQAIGLICGLIVNLGIRISLVYLIVGIIDFIYQKRHFKEEMKMTKQEVKDEYKNAEGDPQIKGQQKARMREASRRRMMQAVPQADVVITNPTHFAVAIKYDSEVDSAPVVIAKGADYFAERIKNAAREHGIEITENKPLARALYTTVEVGEEIPPELYDAVAVILAAVFTRTGKH